MPPLVPPPEVLVWVNASNVTNATNTSDLLYSYNATIGQWYVANVTNKMRKEAAPARARLSLPQVRERSELYHMSYEALVDTVMEWQRKCGPQTS